MNFEFDPSLPKAELRRQFLKSLAAASAAAMAVREPRLLFGAEREPIEHPRPTADACILLWMGGGMAAPDTFDPKRLSKGLKDPGSYYAAVDTAIPGVQLCEHLSRTAKMLDRCALVRTLNHNVVDEHAAATNRVHTGRPPADSTVYPSIGSIISHQLGAVGDGVPAYVVAGYPSASRGPGFLGASIAMSI